MDRANLLPRIPRSKEPAYRRIYRAFRDAIRSGELKAGQRVPSSRELATRYGVARITVAQAYEQLVAEGYFETRRGAGTFVAKELPDGFFEVGKPQRRDAERKESGEATQLAKPLPFLTGVPALEAFPRELWLKLLSRRMRSEAYSLSAYGSTSGGLQELREAIAGHLRTQRGVECEAGQILILSGSQPGLELTARALVRAGDRVVLENPCFHGMVDSFRLAGAEIHPVSVDGHGMNCDALKRMRKPARLAVVTPARQFPLGVAMPVARQATLLEWARKQKAWILEDDYDSEFRFRGKPLPAMQGLEPNGRILYLGTFSRSMFPDLRIGYLVVPRSVYPDFLALWRAAAMNPPELLQATLACFLREGHYERHVRRMRKLYAERCRFLAELVEAQLGKWLELGATDGGLHFVGYCKQEMDTKFVASRIKEAGVTLAPISRYAVVGLERDGFLFGFSSFSEAEMRRSVETVRKVMASVL